MTKNILALVLVALTACVPTAPARRGNIGGQIGGGFLPPTRITQGAGDISAVNVTGPIAGGGASGAVTISLASCALNEIYKWNGAAWACAVDGNTTYTAGDGLTLTANDFDVIHSSDFTITADQLDLSPAVTAPGTLSTAGTFTAGDTVADAHVLWGQMTSNEAVGSLFTSAAGNLNLIDTTTTAAGVGGGLVFSGAFTGTTITAGALIKLMKTNGVDGQYGFDLVFGGRQTGIGDVAESLRLLGTGGVQVANSSAQGTDRLQLGFTAPNGIIGTKNTSGAPASNLLLQTTDGAGATATILTLGFDKLAAFTGALSTAGSTTLGDATTDTHIANGRLTITGPATTNPLDVTGSSDATGRIVARLSSQVSGAAARLQFSDGFTYNFGIGTAATSGDLVFAPNVFSGSAGTEVMRITQAGDVKIDVSAQARFVTGKLGAPPTITVCGTSPTITANSTNLAGSFTTGAAVTAGACTITWNGTAPATPVCWVTTGVAGTAKTLIVPTTVNTTTMSFSEQVGSSTVYQYICPGSQ